MLINKIDHRTEPAEGTLLKDRDLRVVTFLTPVRRTDYKPIDIIVTDSRVCADRPCRSAGEPR